MPFFLRKYLSIKGSNRFRLESSVIMREPLAIQFYENGVTDSLDLAASVIIGSANTIPSLIGEIFSEEERHLSATYEAILSAVASRHYVSSYFNWSYIPFSYAVLFVQIIE